MQGSDDPQDLRHTQHDLSGHNIRAVATVHEEGFGELKKAGWYLLNAHQGGDGRPVYTMGWIPPEDRPVRAGPHLRVVR